MLAALERYGPNRVVARVALDTDFEALSALLENDKEVPAKVMSERTFLSAQTFMLSVALGFMAGIGGPLTYKNSQLPDVVMRMPSTSFVLETDCPEGLEHDVSEQALTHRRVYER